MLLRACRCCKVDTDESFHGVLWAGAAGLDMSMLPRACRCRKLRTDDLFHGWFPAGAAGLAVRQLQGAAGVLPVPGARQRGRDPLLAQLRAARRPGGAGACQEGLWRGRQNRRRSRDARRAQASMQCPGALPMHA